MSWVAFSAIFWLAVALIYYSVKTIRLQTHMYDMKMLRIIIGIVLVFVLTLIF